MSLPLVRLAACRLRFGLQLLAKSIVASRERSSERGYAKLKTHNSKLLMSTRVLVAGDHFILPSVFADAIRAEVITAIEFREYQSPWPGVPFGDIGEVTEACGSEDELIQALQGVSIYVTNHAPLTKKILAGAPDLKLAVIARGG